MNHTSMTTVTEGRNLCRVINRWCRSDENTGSLFGWKCWRRIKILKFSQELFQYLLMFMTIQSFSSMEHKWGELYFFELTVSVTTEFTTCAWNLIPYEQSKGHAPSENSPAALKMNGLNTNYSTYPNQMPHTEICSPPSAPCYYKEQHKDEM